MTEKQYGGASSYRVKENPHLQSNKENSGNWDAFNPESPMDISERSDLINRNIHKERIKEKEIKKEKNQTEKLEGNTKDNNLYIKAGEIAKKVKIYASSIIKPGMPLLEIAEKIESKIIELGGFPAFPVNLSKNEIAAHATPSYNDTETASGLLKVDIGVHIDGCIADTALSLDLENSEENKKLIECAELCLKNALNTTYHNVELKKIGEAIEKTSHSHNLQPIINLSGHSITKYNLHAGVTIPNYNNSSLQQLEEGVYAIEPFVTLGLGKVIDGKPSGIYMLEKKGTVRDSFAREILYYIEKTYQTLPFCSRWLVKKFETRALTAMKRIEEANLVHHYQQLIESSRKKVAQAEHTIIITEKDKIITT